MADRETYRLARGVGAARAHALAARKHATGMVLLLLMLVATGWGHTDVTVEQAKGMIDANDLLVVIDVRNENEYCMLDNNPGHIPGALNLSWYEGWFATGYQAFDPNDRLLLVCRSGNRSNLAAEVLDGEGYLHVYDMVGGMVAWPYEAIGCVDSEGDGVNDDLDNCPADYNPAQIDSDGDGVGNSCDDDCANLDGLNPVNSVDFAMLAENWQQSGADLDGDFDSDDVVDIDDLVILAVYWLSGCYE